MEVILFILLLLVVINFYLIFRKRGQLQALEKFMISLMSIFLVCFFSQSFAYLFGEMIAKNASPLFNNILLIVMNIVMPIICTEIVLALYGRYMLKKK